MRSADGLPSHRPNGDATADLLPAVNRAVDKYMQSKGVAGLAVGIVAEGKAHSLFYGTTERDAAGALDENTLFEIGSITKVFTTTLLADMHLRNELTLDDPVNRYLPASARLPRHDGVDVTLRHLATHTSGLPRLPGNLDGPDLDPANPYAHYAVADLYACLASMRLKFKPGTKTEYSNLGMGLLGHVLAQAATTDFEALVKRRICEPLGMTDTTVQLSDDQRQRLAVGHSRGKPVPNWDLPTLAGAGALRSSLRDMLRFLHANIEPSATPLQNTLQLAHEIQTQFQYRFYYDFGCIGPLVAAGLTGLFAWHSFGLPLWARVVAVLAVDAVLFRFWPLGLSTMTLGWHVDDLFGNAPVLWHNGGTGGYASYMGFVPETRCGVVLLANSDNGPDPVGRKILRDSGK